MNPARKIIAGSLLAIALLSALLFWSPRTRMSEPTRRPLLVYCAAGLKGPMEAVARDYELRTGVPIQLQFGGSGLLLSNLRIARQGDLFLAADNSFLDAARSNGILAEIVPLARMTPVIAVPRGNPRSIISLQDLGREGVQIAFANPESTAIGRVARKALEQSGDWSAIQSRIKVLKPTVNDVANDVKLGTVDAGIVWDATAAQYPELIPVRVPQLEGAVADVGIGVLTSCDQPAAALRFARYLGSRDRGLPEFTRAGFQVVPGDAWTERPEVVLYSGGVNRIAIEDTVRQFEQREGVSVTRVYNGCGILTAQIRAGQRPDAYFACDVSFMSNVAPHFLPSRELADTRLVILTRPGNPKGLHSLKDLTQPGLSLGVAHEQQSALGALTVSLLRSENLLSEVMPNVRVQSPTADLLVNQLRAGSLDAVIVYSANASAAKGILDAVELPQPGALAIQPFAVGRTSEHAQLMERLLDQLRSPASRLRFQQAGFHWRDESPAP